METDQVTEKETAEEIKTNKEAIPINEAEIKTNKEEIPMTEAEIKTNEKPITPFKKPVLIGKIGRLPRKIVTTKNTEEKNIPSEIECTHNGESNNIEISAQPEPKPDVQSKPVKAPAQQLAENSVPLPYKEPSWSGLPHTSSKEYVFEVLKSGVIVDHINLMEKPFWVFGRQPNCEIYMAHPTISRYHAVLQYRQEGTEESPPGFYIYDLSSTHGTFLNKGRLKPRVYAPLKVGHMIKLGFSTRSYVLTGPDEDAEEESEFTLTELKQQRAEKLLQKELAEKEALAKQEKEKEQQRKRDEERGVDWGLGEDADEETDLAENPYAQSNNEELYLDDPKKALRGFMEREGYDLDYDCTEQGFGQFLCKVELPVDDDRGRPIVAEVLHKGKKKEAVIQCALEACRILDRYGVLRQATHESRKRKAKNWEENDYYDSDEDTFLDRTGSIEKKREKRMQSKVPQQPETYQSLLEKEKKISDKIAQIEQQLSNVKSENSNKSSSAEEDPLDSFMKELKQSKLDKQTISKLKSELVALKVEQLNMVKLVNLAKPADLPPLVISNKNSAEQQGTSGVRAKVLPIFGKRPKIKVQFPAKLSTKDSGENVDVNVEEKEEEEDEEEMETQIEEDLNENAEEFAKNQTQTESPETETNQESTEAETEPTGSTEAEKKPDNVPCHIKVYLKITELEKLLTENKFPPVLETYVSEVRDVLQKVKDLTEYQGRIQSNKKTIMAKNLKVKKHIDNLMESYNEQHLVRICKQFQRICVEIREMTQKQHKIHNKIRILGMKIDLLCKEIVRKISELKESNTKSEEFSISKPNDDETLHSEDEEENDKDGDKPLTPEELEKRRKKNKRRLQHRQERAEIEKQKGYREDARREDYNMWVPPQNQTGDGRTTLNEKYGY